MPANFLLEQYEKLGEEGIPAVALNLRYTISEGEIIVGFTMPLSETPSVECVRSKVVVENCIKGLGAVLPENTSFESRTPHRISGDLVVDRLYAVTQPSGVRLSNREVLVIKHRTEDGVGVTIILPEKL